MLSYYFEFLEIVNTLHEVPQLAISKMERSVDVVYINVIHVSLVLEAVAHLDECVSWEHLVNMGLGPHACQWGNILHSGQHVFKNSIPL